MALHHAPCLLSRYAGKSLNKKKPAATYFPAFSSIIGAGELDFRVRYGNGYCLSAMATGILNRIIYFRNTPPKRRIPEESEKGTMKENDNMAKPHGLLVLLG